MSPDILRRDGNMPTGMPPVLWTSAAKFCRFVRYWLSVKPELAFWSLWPNYDPEKETHVSHVSAQIRWYNHLFLPPCGAPA